MKKRRPQEGWAGESGAQLGKTSCGPGPGAKSPRFGAGCSPPGTQPHTAPPRGNPACQEAPRAAVPALRPPGSLSLGPFSLGHLSWSQHHTGVHMASKLQAMSRPPVRQPAWRPGGCLPGPHRDPTHPPPAAPGQSLFVLLPSPALIQTRWPALCSFPRSRPPTCFGVMGPASPLASPLHP